MSVKILVCPHCHNQIQLQDNVVTQGLSVLCPVCGVKTVDTSSATILEELAFYPVNEPFAYVKICKNPQSLEKTYHLIEPYLSDDELSLLRFIQDQLTKGLDVSLEALKPEEAVEYLDSKIDSITRDYKIKMDDVFKKKVLYYVSRDSLGFGLIDPLMRDPNIEDISCDGANVPIFLYHREYGSLKSNILFTNDEHLSRFVVLLAQKCGKHISISEPMLDATMPDGSRIQMTLGTEVTAKGSTFTIRRFRSDPFTPIDLINFHTMSSEMVAYMWMAVENGVNALIAGGTASGKTSTLNAMSLFIPKEAKIVSIEETREINLPHPNWIPGVARPGLGEIIGDRFVGEIDMYDLMKAALRQRPEYILVGEIRGREAYVLFQAMATGHTTYSTFHADSAQSLIHRLEGKPIEIPRVMLQSLDIVTIQVSTRVKDKKVRRCKQIIEIVDIDPMSKEILTNEAFHWDQVEDAFVYSGRSYVLERIRSRWDLSKEQLIDEMRRRVEILEWMRRYNIRAFTDVAWVVAQYSEKPDEFINMIRDQSNQVLTMLNGNKKKQNPFVPLTANPAISTGNSKVKIKPGNINNQVFKKKGSFWVRRKSREGEGIG